MNMVHILWLIIKEFKVCEMNDYLDGSEWSMKPFVTILTDYLYMYYNLSSLKTHFHSRNWMKHKCESKTMSQLLEVWCVSKIKAILDSNVASNWKKDEEKRDVWKSPKGDWLNQMFNILQLSFLSHFIKTYSFCSPEYKWISIKWDRMTIILDFTCHMYLDE